MQCRVKTEVSWNRNREIYLVWPVGRFLGNGWMDYTYVGRYRPWGVRWKCDIGNLYCLEGIEWPLTRWLLVFLRRSSAWLVIISSDCWCLVIHSMHNNEHEAIPIMTRDLSNQPRKQVVTSFFDIFCLSFFRSKNIRIWAFSSGWISKHQGGEMSKSAFSIFL